MSDTPGGPTPPPKATALAIVPPGAPRGRKRWIALLVLLAIVIPAGIYGIRYWLDARQYESTDDAIVDGSLAPASAQVAGRIKTVYIHDNQDVAAGAPIAEIDPTDFQTKVSQAQAMLASAQAREQAAQTSVQLMRVSTDAIAAQAKADVEQSQAGVTQAQAGIEMAQATIRWAKAQVDSAQADVDAAQAEATRRNDDMKRYDALGPGAVSQQQREAARSAADAAAAQLSAMQKRKIGTDAQVAQEESKLNAAQSAVTEAQSKVEHAKGVLQAAETAPQQIATAEAQVKTAQATIEEANAALLAAQQQLSYTTITAPIAGRITRKNVQPGQYVEAGQALCTIVSPDVWVTANFKETQLTHMHAGQEVEIEVDAYPGRTFKGTVESIQAGTGARFSLMPPENATGNFVKVVQRVPVKITFNEDASAKQLLAPGMSVTPRVRIAGNEGTPGPIARASSSPTTAIAKP